MYTSGGGAVNLPAVRAHPPQSETHTAGSRAFLAHPKSLLEQFVIRSGTAFPEGSGGSFGALRGPATIDQQHGSNEQGFHEILLS